MKTIVLVTASSMPEPDPESHLLVTALEQRGVRSQVLAWDAEFDWSSADLVVVRSAWDYFERLDEFLSWADAVESVSCLVNPASVLRWNTHKRYLTELIERGVPTVPTVVVAKASALPDLPAARFASAQKGRTYTARIREADVRDAFARVDLPDVEALAQVGTSAGLCGFVDALEVRHGQRVVAVNTATYWLALREHGISDRLDGPRSAPRAPLSFRARERHRRPIRNRQRRAVAE